VGDAARQAADRFHFLGLPQLLLELDPLRDIAPDAEDADEPSLVELGSRGELSDTVVALRGPDAELAGGAELTAYHPPQQLERERQILGMHQPLERLAHPFLAPPAGDRLERRVEGCDGAFGGERENDVPHAFDERAVALLGLPQRRFGVTALRDVTEVHHDGATAAPRGGPRRRRRYGATTRPCGASELQARSVPARHDVAQRGVNPPHVVGMHPLEPG